MNVSGSSALRRCGLIALRGQWQTALQVAFVAGLIGVFQDSLQLRFNFNWGNMSLPDHVTSVFSSLAPHTGLLTLLSIIRILLGPVLAVGLCAYFLALHRGQNPTFSVLFSKMQFLWRCMGMYLLMGLFIFLWSLLFVIPGIIAAYRYAMAPYILADNPDIDAFEAIRRSKTMMDGHKLRLFVLQMSFIGWFILSVVAVSVLYAILGIVGTALGLFASLVLQVYMQSATTAFYREMAY